MMRCLTTHPGFTEGDVPLALQKAIAAGDWEDVSYQHDAVPSFFRTKSNLTLYVNRFYPEDRFEGPGAPRFNLVHDTDGGAPDVDLYVGEEWTEVEKYVAAFEKGMQL
jgi:hypothetical protein